MVDIVALGDLLLPKLRAAANLLEPAVVFPLERRPEWTVWNSPLLFLPLPFLLLQAYLLFSPDSPSHNANLRLAVMPLSVLATLQMGFARQMPVSEDSHLRDFNHLGALYSLVFTGTALELGLRTKPPVWVGWTGTQVGDVKAALSNGKSQADATKERTPTTTFVSEPDEGTRLGTLRLACRYLYSMRNIGFTPGLAPSFFTPAPQAVERWTAAWREARILLFCYLLIDFLILPFSFHADFRTIEGSGAGSLYAPLGAPFPAGIPPWLSTIVLTFCIGVSLHVVQVLMYRIVALPAIVFSPSPTASLYWPQLFQHPEGTSSLTELWSMRWHSLFRASLGFCGYDLAKNVGAPRAVSVMATFLLSATMHWIAVEALGKGPEYGPTWPLFRFFAMQGVGVLLEGAFRKATGRRTKGLWGRLWTWSWIFLWAPSAMEVYARRGQMAGMSLGSLSAGRPCRWLLNALSDRFGWGLY